jgi:hypothetical protein
LGLIWGWLIKINNLLFSGKGLAGLDWEFSGRRDGRRKERPNPQAPSSREAPSFKGGWGDSVIKSKKIFQMPWKHKKNPFF